MGAAHGALVLQLDSALDAFPTENVLAGGDDGVVKLVETDGAFLAGVNGELEEELEGGAVFFVEDYNFVFFEQGEEVGYSRDHVSMYLYTRNNRLILALQQIFSPF